MKSQVRILVVFVKKTHLGLHVRFRTQILTAVLVIPRGSCLTEAIAALSLTEEEDEEGRI